MKIINKRKNMLSNTVTDWWSLTPVLRHGRANFKLFQLQKTLQPMTPEWDAFQRLALMVRMIGSILIREWTILATRCHAYSPASRSIRPRIEMAKEVDSNLLSPQPPISEGTKEPTCCPALRCSFSLYTKGTLFSSIFTLLTTSIGAGTLALPYAFSQGGLVYAGSVLLLVMLISIVAGLFLFSSKRYASELFPTVDILGYEDLAELTFGAAGRVRELNEEFTTNFSQDL